jgi:hypothetical protein
MSENKFLFNDDQPEYLQPCLKSFLLDAETFKDEISRCDEQEIL